MASFVRIFISLDQIHPPEVWENLTLNLIAHTPQKEIVYFRASRTLAAVEVLRLQMPNLKALDLFMVPLYATLVPSVSQDGSYIEERSPPSLQHPFLDHLANSFDWVPLIEFLSRRTSHGNPLDSL